MCKAPLTGQMLLYLMKFPGAKSYVFQARAVTANGYSNWGDPIARIAV